MANKISPGLPIASSCLLKISSKLISLPILVKLDVFVVKDIAGIAFSFLNIFQLILRLDVENQQLSHHFTKNYLLFFFLKNLDLILLLYLSHNCILQSY